MPVIKLKWGKQEMDVDVEEGSTVELFKTQVWTMTNVPVDRQKYMGFGAGLLKDTDDLMAKVKQIKPGKPVTLMGTAEGGELKEPAEKVLFVEDLSPEEKAKLMKEKKMEVLPAGIKNLGNTCYMNSCLQCLNGIKEIRDALSTYRLPSATERNVDAVLTEQFRQTTIGLTNTTDAITPLQFVMALRQRFPRFGEMQNGHYMQQDADECLRGLLTVLSGTLVNGGTNKIDELFSFRMKSKLKCLECDEEPPTESEEMQRVLMCHLGTQTDTVSHIHQGITLSLKEHVEKNSPVLGRNAQYEKSSALESLPSYLVVQYARFGFKAAHDWAGTAAAKVKITRKCSFGPMFDMFDCASEELRKKLTVGRLKKKEQEDAALEKDRAEAKAAVASMEAGVASSSAAPAAAADVEMKPAEETKDVEMTPQDEYDTGYYELIGIISHKGRTADGGHYVGWCLHEKGGKVEQIGSKKEVKDDRWLLFDDEEVTAHNWKDLVGLGTDLQGGKVDTQIAYINIYKKITVKEQGHVLGGGSEGGYAGAAGASAS
jgi:ubiquitin carboxyl-terminal hydrolase 14